MEDNIEMNLKETGWEDMDWIQWASRQEQVAGCCEYGNEPLGSIKCRKFLDKLRSCQLHKKEPAPKHGQICLSLHARHNNTLLRQN
jgi:hypothetical protein